MVNMDNLYTKEEADNKYSTKSMVYDLQQYLEDNYMSWDQVQAGYYDKNDRDSKFVLKTQITKLQNKIATLESRLAALEQNGNQGSASSYATKAELLQYRKLNDLLYHNHQELPIANKEVLLDDDDEPLRFTTSLYFNRDVYTGAIYIMDDNGYYSGCEITSAILDEDISLSTNNELSKYCTINELRRYGLSEIQPERSVTLPY